MTRVISSEVEKLLEDLNPIADDWDLFAGQLGVEKGKRRQIRSENASKPLQCFSDALHCWVESSDDPTYEDVIKVLMGKTVRNVFLAKLINSKHKCNLQITFKQEAKAQDGQTKVIDLITGKKDKQKISFCTRGISLDWLLAFIIAVIILGGYVPKLNDTSSNQPADDPSSISKEIFISTPSEQENIKLVYQGNIYVDHNLPYLPDKLFGRGNDLRNLIHLLLNHTSSGVNAVAVYGPPAVGKSTLAIRFGNELASRGVTVGYVNVQENSVFRRLDKVRTHMKQTAKDYVPSHTHELTKRYPGVIIGVNAQTSLLNWAKNLKSETLLILDNYDTIEDKLFLWDLRHASKFLRVLITRQAKLTVRGYEQHHLEYLDMESAIELLRHKLSHQTRLSDADSRAICEAVDKNPLGLKIVACILTNDTLIQHFIDSLKADPIKLLNEDVGLPGNSTLLAVLSLAYNRLIDSSKLCGHYISNFPGSFDSELGGRILGMCLNDKMSYSSSECLKELADRSLLESYVDNNQKRHNLHQLVRAFFQYVDEEEFTANHSEVVLTSDREIFNHSFVHSYVDAIDQVLSKCRDHCTEKDSAFIKRENDNIWMAIRTIKYLCHGNRPNLLSFVMNWTQTYAHLSRSGELRFLITIDKRADSEVIGDTLRCLDHLVASSSEAIEADKVLKTYTTLVDLAEFDDSGECVNLCKTAYESKSRRVLLDSPCLANSSTKHLAHLKLMISTLPAFCLFRCRYLEVTNYIVFFKQAGVFVLLGFLFFYRDGPRWLSVLMLGVIFYILHQNVFPWYVSLIHTINVTSIYSALWRVSSSFLEYKSLPVLIFAMHLMYVFVNAKDTTLINYMADDIIYHRYGSVALIGILLLSFVFRLLLFVAVKCFVKRTALIYNCVSGFTFCLCPIIKHKIFKYYVKSCLYSIIEHIKYLYVKFRLCHIIEHKIFKCFVKLCLCLTKKEKLLSLISYMLLYCAIPITSYLTALVIFYFVH